MNRLRSIFIIPAIMLCTGLSLHAVYQLWMAFSWGWIGALLASALLPLLVSWLMVGGVARTSRSLPMSLLVLAIGLTVAVADWLHQANLPALIHALLGGVIFALYDFWYSRLDRPGSRIAVGKPLPEIQLTTLDGQPLSSRSFIGRATLLLFFRGNWCPLCMAQVKEVADHYRELDDLGVRVVLVSPQSSRHSVELARRFQVSMEFLLDPDAAAARALGIDAVNGTPLGLGLLGYENDTVLPTVVLSDHQGVVVFTDETDNYRIRPEPATFLAIARSRL